MTEETRRFVFLRDAYVCRRCGGRATQIAHRIARTKTWIRVYGRKVIDHPYNLVAVCSLSCNSSFNIGGKPVEREAIAEAIRKELSREKLVRGKEG